MIFPDGLCALVRRAQAGDRQAQIDLLQRLQPSLEQLSQRYDFQISPAETASDLSQEATLRLWERLAQFEGSVDDQSTAAMFYKWIEQLVRRLAINRQAAHRAARRAHEGPMTRLNQTADHLCDPVTAQEPADDAPSPSSIAGSEELDRMVQSAVDEIPNPTDRQILQLCFFESLSLRAVAERLDLSYDVVRSRYHAGLRFLERQLKGLI